MRWVRIVWVLVALAGGLGGCVSQGEVGRKEGSSAWEHLIVSPFNHMVFGATFVSEKEGWAVGERGVILHYQDGKWTPWNTPTGRHLFSVAFPAPQEGWAVGIWGTILHYNGTEWGAIRRPEGFEGISFEKVVFTSPTDGWAIGDSAGIVHYDGVKWQKMDAPIMQLIQERQVETKQYGLLAEAIGESGFEEEAGYFHDIVFPSPKDGWIVGNLGQILHYDGEKWQEVKSPTRKHLYSLCFLPSGEAWAVGQEGTLLHYDGKAWQLWPSSPTRRHLLSVAAVLGKEVYAVGMGGMILRWDGQAWKVIEGPQVKRMVHFYCITVQRPEGGPQGRRRWSGDLTSSGARPLWVFSSTRSIFRYRK